MPDSESVYRKPYKVQAWQVPDQEAPYADASCPHWINQAMCDGWLVPNLGCGRTMSLYSRPGALVLIKPGDWIVKDDNIILAFNEREFRKRYLVIRSNIETDKA